jgi:alkylhydroperoxidase family enzyme
MARATPPRERAAGVRARTAFWLTGRPLGQLAGRPAHPDRRAGPVRACAHLLGVLRGYARLERATAGTHQLDQRHRALAEPATAAVTHRGHCIDLGSPAARRWGVTDEELLALPRYQTSPLFDQVDKLVLTYAEGVSRTPADVPADLVQRLREHVTDAQIVELTHLVALENPRGRLNLAPWRGRADAALDYRPGARSAGHGRDAFQVLGAAATMAGLPAATTDPVHLRDQADERLRVCPDMHARPSTRGEESTSACSRARAGGFRPCRPSPR